MLSGCIFKLFPKDDTVQHRPPRPQSTRGVMRQCASFFALLPAAAARVLLAAAAAAGAGAPRPALPAAVCMAIALNRCMSSPITPSTTGFKAWQGQGQAAGAGAAGASCVWRQ